jgi:hypothetical protein
MWLSLAQFGLSSAQLAAWSQVMTALPQLAGHLAILYIINNVEETN